MLTKPIIGLCGLAFCLSACAGTPPNGSSNRVAASKKCERSVGSLLCGGDDEGSSSNLNSPVTSGAPVNGAASGSFSR